MKGTNSITFKKGDFLLCVDDKHHGSVRNGQVYTAEYDGEISGTAIKELGMACYNSRFIKVDLTELERIIYGV